MEINTKNIKIKRKVLKITLFQKRTTNIKNAKKALSTKN